MKALSFWEILWDIYPDKKFLGGAPLNFAAHFAKHGGDAYMMSALGNDELKSAALERIRAMRVHSEYIAVSDDRPTGRCLITLDEDSIPHYDIVQNVAYDNIPFPDLSEGFDLLYFGTLALRSEANLSVLKRLIKENNFSEILADVNVRLPYCSKTAVLFTLENATVLKVSAEEMPIIAEFLSIPHQTDPMLFSKETARRYGNLKCIIITLGADGAYALDCGEGKEYSTPALKSKVVSTVGAGDSFSASFICLFLQKKDIQHCLDHAARVAGFVVSEYDAVPDYKVEDLMP